MDQQNNTEKHGEQEATNPQQQPIVCKSGGKFQIHPIITLICIALAEIGIILWQLYEKLLPSFPIIANVGLLLSILCFGGFGIYNVIKSDEFQKSYSKYSKKVWGAYAVWCVTLSVFFVFVSWSETQENVAANEWQPPELPPNCKFAYVSLGDAQFEIDLTKITPRHPFIPPGWGENPITVRLKNNRLYVDADAIYHGTDVTGLTMDPDVLDNGLRTGWDRNFSPNVFEVVNQDTNPVFQAIYIRPNSISLNGVFIATPTNETAKYPGLEFGQFLVMFSFGTNFSLSVADAKNVQQIVRSGLTRYNSFREFNYPAYDHLGQFATAVPQAPNVQPVVMIQQPDFIEGTRFTQKELSKLFPFGYAVFFYGENHILRNEIFKNGMMDWKLDVELVSITPDFNAGQVTWKLPGVGVQSQGTGDHIIINNMTLTVSLPLKEGCIREAGMDFGNNPVLYVMTLSEDQAKPIFALGFRIPSPTEPQPQGQPFIVQP